MSIVVVRRDELGMPMLLGIDNSKCKISNAFIVVGLAVSISVHSEYDTQKNGRKLVLRGEANQVFFKKTIMNC